MPGNSSAEYMKAYRAANKDRIKASQAAYWRKYFQENKRALRAKLKKWLKTPAGREFTYRSKLRRQEANRMLVVEAKSVPCADCGLNWPYFVMDFDHCKGKKVFQISDRGRRRTASALIAEMSKCDVVCTLCHRFRTYERAVNARKKLRRRA